MVKILPFCAIRPSSTLAKEVASPPYDVLSYKEAKALYGPRSFLRVTRADAELDEGADAKLVHDKAAENLQSMLGAEGVLKRDETPAFYLYEMSGGSGDDAYTQLGVVCTTLVEDYANNIVRKHETTRPDKEQDRVDHMETLSAQVGPVLLTYRDSKRIAALLKSLSERMAPHTDFVADDNVRHRLWSIDKQADIDAIRNAFDVEVEVLYIADGHHRSAAAKRVRDAERARRLSKATDGRDVYDATARNNGVQTVPAYECFMCVAFACSQMRCLAYNRVVRTLGDLSVDAFLGALAKDWTLEKLSEGVEPSAPRTFCMCVRTDDSGSVQWFLLRPSPSVMVALSDADAVARLDVQILTANLLEPILGIKDQRRDERIDFVGGSRGVAELERQVRDGEAVVAFASFPTRMQELFDVSDACLSMPPKSTWFAPKLRSGLFVHELDLSK